MQMRSDKLVVGWECCCAGTLSTGDRSIRKLAGATINKLLQNDMQIGPSIKSAFVAIPYCRQQKASLKVDDKNVLKNNDSDSHKCALIKMLIACR